MSNFANTTYLELPLYNADPDVLGFAKVSGFYGPGAWAAWFLATCSSWYSLLSDGEGTLTRLCFYLIPLNAVSVDYLRHLARLKSLQASADPAWMYEAAPMGAAYNVIWWGLCGSLAQLLFTLYRRSGSSYCGTSLTRFFPSLILAITSIIPAIAAGGVAFTIDEETRAHIPALYWKGMHRIDGGTYVRTGIDYMSMEAIYITSPLVGLWHILAYSLYGLGSTMSYLQQRPLFLLDWFHWTQPSGFARWPPMSPALLPSSAVGMITLASFVVAPATFVLWVIWHSAAGNAPLWILGLAVLPLLWYILIGLALFTLPVMTILYFGFTVRYIVTAYLIHPSIHKESCFFMPCAPQSVGDIDQLMSLVMGIFTVLVVDVIIPYRRKRKEASRSQRLFEQNTARAIELRTMVRSNRAIEGNLDRDIFGVAHDDVETGGGRWDEPTQTP